jgi:(hydroxyamino)benzene mutase
MKLTTSVKNQAEKLIFLGVLLFFLGLIVGLLAPLLTNPRMGLSSHIEGVMNGMLLVILGLIWNRVKLSPRWLKITFWLAVYGTFANWFGIFVAAAFNAGKRLTIAARGQQGHPFAEAVVEFSLISLTLAMLMVSIMVLIGLARNNR